MMKPLGGAGVKDLQEKKSAFIFNRLSASSTWSRSESKHTPLTV